MTRVEVYRHLPGANGDEWVPVASVDGMALDMVGEWLAATGRPAGYYRAISRDRYGQALDSATITWEGNGMSLT